MGRFRDPIQAAIDVASWVAGFYLGVWFRFDFQLDQWPHTRVLAVFGFAAALQIASGLAFGLYSGRWRFGSFEEVAAVAQATLLVGGAVFVVNRFVYTPRLLPVSVAMAGAVVAVLVQLGARYLWRLFIDRGLRPGANAERVLIFGAGEGGEQLITTMLRNPASPFLPVALLDDHPSKAHLRLRGVPVVGSRTDLVAAAREFDADHLIIALPSAPTQLLRDLSTAALDANLRVSVLPPVAEFLSGSVQVADVRPLDERDLLGRHEVRTYVDQIAGYVTGKRVMVTGAGGSIGSELCRQLAKFEPSELIMLDRDESAIHAVQLSIEGRAMLDSRNLVIADIRDKERLGEVFDELEPQVIFHAAALKHMPLLEMHPSEGEKTNVFGTLNLLELARDHNVERFVNVSTDKAADPCNVLGYTKRIAERLCAHIASESKGTFQSVRFGNVLGSRGSVLTAFRKQIENGGPITVTHPDVTRFFMTVEEAVQLVIQAGAIGRDGEALVLDMGEPIKIDDVARRLAAQAEEDIEIVYTGLRDGEKLHEVLFSPDESGTTAVHPLIHHVNVPPLSKHDLRVLDGSTPVMQRVASESRVSDVRDAGRPKPGVDLSDVPDATISS